MPERRNGRRHRVTTVLVAAGAMFAAAGYTSSASPASAPMSYAIYPSIPGQPAPTQNARKCPPGGPAATLEEDLPCAVGESDAQTIHVLDNISSYTIDVTARLPPTPARTAQVPPVQRTVSSRSRRFKDPGQPEARLTTTHQTSSSSTPKDSCSTQPRASGNGGYGPALGTGSLQAGRSPTEPSPLTCRPAAAGSSSRSPGYSMDLLLGHRNLARATPNEAIVRDRSGLVNALRGVRRRPHTGLRRKVTGANVSVEEAQASDQNRRNLLRPCSASPLPAVRPHPVSGRVVHPRRVPPAVVLRRETQHGGADPRDRSRRSEHDRGPD